MMNKIEQLAENLKTESRMMADRAIAGLRNAGLETADMISRTKAPVHAFADSGLKLNALSHKSIEKLVKQQIAMFDDLVDGSARRIEMAARAKSVKVLGDLVKDVVVDISKVRPTRKPATRKAAGRPAAKKAAVRKPRAKKAAARKPAARKAAPKAAA